MLRRRFCQRVSVDRSEQFGRRNFTKLHSSSALGPRQDFFCLLLRLDLRLPEQPHGPELCGVWCDETHNRSVEKLYGNFSTPRHTWLVSRLSEISQTRRSQRSSTTCNVLYVCEYVQRLAFRTGTRVCPGSPRCLFTGSRVYRYMSAAGSGRLRACGS
jgi:hypothetical protein